MADPERPLMLVTGDAAGICDPETGICVLPDPDGATDAEPEPLVSESP